MKRAVLLSSLLLVLMWGSIAQSMSTGAPGRSRPTGALMARQQALPSRAIVTIWSAGSGLVARINRGGVERGIPLPPGTLVTAFASSDGRQIAASMLAPGDDFAIYTAVWRPGRGWKTWTTEGTFHPRAFRGPSELIGDRFGAVARVVEPPDGETSSPEEILSTPFVVENVNIDAVSGNYVVVEGTFDDPFTHRVAVYSPSGDLLWALGAEQLEYIDLSFSPVETEIMFRAYNGEMTVNETRQYDWTENPAWGGVIASGIFSPSYLPDGGRAWVVPSTYPGDPDSPGCTLWMQAPGKPAVWRHIADGFIGSISAY